MCGGDDAIPYSNRFEVGTPNEHKIELTRRSDLLPAGAVIAYQHGGGAGFGPRCCATRRR